jgi:hypothetical protein
MHRTCGNRTKNSIEFLSELEDFFGKLIITVSPAEKYSPVWAATRPNHQLDCPPAITTAALGSVASAWRLLSRIDPRNLQQLKDELLPIREILERRFGVTVVNPPRG